MSSKKMAVIAIAAFALAARTSGDARAGNLVQNGGFETTRMPQMCPIRTRRARDLVPTAAWSLTGRARIIQTPATRAEIPVPSWYRILGRRVVELGYRAGRGDVGPVLWCEQWFSRDQSGWRQFHRNGR